jgi:cytochrome c553
VLVKNYQFSAQYVMVKMEFPETPRLPNLAGMSSLYLEKSLVDYRKGIRQDRRMSLIASALSMEQIKDLAAWYSAFEISVKVPEID